MTGWRVAARPLLGTATDRVVGEQVGVSTSSVAHERRRLGIARYVPPPPAHGTPARYQRGCRCDECREAKALTAAREYAASGRTAGAGEMDAAARERLAARRTRALRESAERATVRGVPWTEAEIVLALDRSRSAAQVADLLGRSKAAVEHQRARRIGDATTGPLPRGRRAAQA